MKYLFLILFFLPIVTFSSEIRVKKSLDILDEDEFITYIIKIHKTSEQNDLFTNRKAKFSILTFLQKKINEKKQKNEEVLIKYPSKENHEDEEVPYSMNHINSTTTIDTSYTQIINHKDIEFLIKRSSDFSCIDNQNNQLGNTNTLKEKILKN